MTPTLITLKNPTTQQCINTSTFRPGACDATRTVFRRMDYGGDGLVFGLTDLTRASCVKLSPDGTYAMDSMKEPKVIQPCIPFTAADVYRGLMGYEFLYGKAT